MIFIIFPWRQSFNSHSNVSVTDTGWTTETDQFAFRIHSIFEKRFGNMGPICKTARRMAIYVNKVSNVYLKSHEKRLRYQMECFPHLAHLSNGWRKCVYYDQIGRSPFKVRRKHFESYRKRKKNGWKMSINCRNAQKHRRRMDDRDGQAVRWWSENGSANGKKGTRINTKAKKYMKQQTI